MSDIGPADDLTETLAAAFRLLEHGVADRRSAFRTPSLATVDAAGWPRQRTVVLRAFDAETRVLRIHSDKRSAKTGEITRDPRVCILGYDAPARTQLRLTGRATLHTSDAIADDAWRNSEASSRRGYAASHAPGTILHAPPDPPDDAEAGRVHFQVIQVTIETLEWLWLAASGHRRALFTWRDEVLNAHWLAP